MPRVVMRIVSNSTKEKHVTRDAVLKGEIVINIPMVIMKIIANSRKERDVTKKDGIMKRHAAKNIGSRGKTKILKDAVMKRHATENVSLRKNMKIYTIIIKTKIIANSQGVLEI